MKRPRKVALIAVADYPRALYSAYWTIGVEGNDEDGYRWQAEIHAYEPIGWKHKDKLTADRPDVPQPVYPSDAHLKRQADYLRMIPEQQRVERTRQDAFRAECARIHAAHPQPVHAHDTMIGVSDTRAEADTAAQTWVLGQMKKHKRPDANKEAGYALGFGPLDLLAELLLWLLRPLLALAFSTTIRDERAQRTQVNIDLGAGAGLMRIYDGTRPATCGAATTLLAELTHSDPCAGAAAGGVLTFSAITPDASANATGTATWYRDVDSTGTCCVDGNVGTAGSDLNLNTTSINVGVQVAVTSKTYTEGNP